MRVFVLFVLFFSVNSMTIGATAAQPTIDIMSFNIRYGTAEDGQNHWDIRKNLVLDVIRQHKPEILGLQEALRFQIEYIKDNIPGYMEVGEGKKGGELGEFSAILYRDSRFDPEKSGTFWLSETSAIPSIGWGNTTPRICTWARFIDSESNMAFYVYNTHLDYKSQQSRELSVRMISKHIVHREFQDPFVLMGDFNAGEGSPSIRFLKGDEVGKPIPTLLMNDRLKWLHPAFRKLNLNFRKETTSLPVKDTYRELIANETNVNTNHGFKGSRQGIKVDYIFVQTNTKTLHAEIVQTDKDGLYPSDHFPVTARLSFSTTPTLIKQ